eukprot:2290341-Pleurochrysis_carterae.AAC.1
MVHVPQGVTFATRGSDAASAAFAGATGITQIRFDSKPGKETAAELTLGGSICNGCTALRYVSLGDQYIALGNNEFKGCAALERVVVRRELTITSTSGTDSPFAGTPFATIFADGTGPHPAG